jgi:secondary thiamine-phosphate synthase enzyme
MRRFILEIETDGNTDVINLHPHVAKLIEPFTGDGLVHLFVVGSTAALSTMEYEPGLVQHDLKDVLQRLVPDDSPYHHEETWNDDNGHSHLRATLMGPSLTLPFSAGKLLTGDYQQVVLVDYDTSPRKRKVIVTVVS